MPKEPGKYDGVCGLARTITHAEVCAIIVINGEQGSGFSVQSTVGAEGMIQLADALQFMVGQIRQDAIVMLQQQYQEEKDGQQDAADNPGQRVSPPEGVPGRDGSGTDATDVHGGDTA